MIKGIQTIIYPVKDTVRGKKLFGALLGVEPYVDEPYYVGFRVGDQEVGLDPNGHTHGMTCYWQVASIERSLKLLVDSGATWQIETFHKVLKSGRGFQAAQRRTACQFDRSAVHPRLARLVVVHGQPSVARPSGPVGLYRHRNQTVGTPSANG
jgi:hypothetical protein